MLKRIEARFWKWVIGWGSLLDGTVVILTFGFVSPSFGYKAACKYSKTHWEGLKKQKKVKK